MSEHANGPVVLKDAPDPSPWWVTLVAAVGCGILIISVYLVSAAWYRAANGYQDEVVVDAQNRALADLKAAQEQQLQETGPHEVEEGTQAQRIKIDDAMQEVAREN